MIVRHRKHDHRTTGLQKEITLNPCGAFISPWRWRGRAAGGVRRVAGSYRSTELQTAPLWKPSNIVICSMLASKPDIRSVRCWVQPRLAQLSGAATTRGCEYANGATLFRVCLAADTFAPSGGGEPHAGLRALCVACGTARRARQGRRPPCLQMIGAS